MCKQTLNKTIALPVNSPNKYTSCTRATPIVIAKGDSAASHHYWRPEDQHYLTEPSPNTAIQVQLPNASKIGSTVQGQLPLHRKLSTTAKNAIVLPALKSSSLISLGQLCDDNCKIELHKRELKVCKNKQSMLKGNRNYQDGLWDIPITKTSIIDDNYYSILD